MEDKGTKLAVASIVLGGISLVCCCVWYIGCIAGIAGLAIGFIAYQNEEEGSRELPVLGIVLSALVGGTMVKIICNAIWFMTYKLLLWPAIMLSIITIILSGVIPVLSLIHI